MMAPTSLPHTTLPSSMWATDTYSLRKRSEAGLHRMISAIHDQVALVAKVEERYRLLLDSPFRMWVSGRTRSDASKLKTKGG